MSKKDNIFIEKIIKNYKNNPHKKIISDHKKSLTYSQLINLALSKFIEKKNLYFKRVSTRKRGNQWLLNI